MVRYQTHLSSQLKVKSFKLEIQLFLTNIDCAIDSVLYNAMMCVFFLNSISSQLMRSKVKIMLFVFRALRIRDTFSTSSDENAIVPKDLELDLDFFFVLVHYSIGIMGTN